MTLRTLAKYAGCSVSTVSKAFSYSKEISEELRERIFSIAKELGCYDKYRKDDYAKKVVAVLCPETGSAYYTEILSHLHALIEKRNATISISVTDFSAEKEEELIGFYSSNRRADGLIVINGRVEAKQYPPIPIVYLGEQKGPFGDCVKTDIYSGICEGVYLFKTNGHTRIGFIGENLTRGKEKYFREAMRYYGMSVEEELIVRSDKRFEEAGREGMSRLLTLPEPPTAIMCAYDYIAFGAIEEAEKRGVNVPEDLSVIGMDDIKQSAQFKVPLTSVNSQTEESCRSAVEQLFKKIDNPYYCCMQKTETRSKLTHRASVARCTGK
ncbi:MAG: LacI family DNA-binding transcriptional regulator [Clostridia bacterium]|nr:LacI family DNA-binding transcriptional regulator [Clostridia bacterium]